MLAVHISFVPAWHGKVAPDPWPHRVDVSKKT
jgi:hypothetical protein